MNTTGPSTFAGLRPDLDPLPDSMRHLRIDPDRGWPVPWFVPWIGDPPKPEFRMADGQKFATAVNQNRCWVCGKRHHLSPRRVTFLIGPMSGINRVSSEPPCHLECARYSVRNCPFLSKPHMTRRGHEEVAAMGSCPGVMIERNPGVSLLWTCADFRAVSDGCGGDLVRIGEALAVEFWSEGRAATREEVLHSVETGLPILTRMAAEDGPRAILALERMTREFFALVPQRRRSP